MQVVYTGGGSSKGRKDFSQNSTDFAISEIPYQGADEQGNADTSNGRDFAYLPIVAGGTAFIYQLKIGGELVRTCGCPARRSPRSSPTRSPTGTTRRSPRTTTAARSRRCRSCRWSAPTAPARRRSSPPGWTTQYPDVWRPFFGRSGLTSYYPRKGRGDRPGRLGPGDEHDRRLRGQRDHRLRRVLLPAQHGLPGRQGAQQGGLLRRADAVQHRGRADQGEDQPGHELATST